VPTDRAPEPASIYVGAVVVVVLTWWATYGRTTPFPSIWSTVPESENLIWFWIGVVAVTVVLVALCVKEPRLRWSAPLGVATWIVLSVWSARRGDGDGLWALSIPFYVAIGLTMLLGAEGARRRARRGKALVVEVPKG